MGHFLIFFTNYKISAAKKRATKNVTDVNGKKKRGRQDWIVGEKHFSTNYEGKDVWTELKVTLLKLFCKSSNHRFINIFG